VKLRASLSEEVAVPRQGGGNLLSENVVTNAVLCILHAQSRHNVRATISGTFTVTLILEHDIYVYLCSMQQLQRLQTSSCKFHLPLQQRRHGEQSESYLHLHCKC
jgi:hypothetical protein